MNSKPRPFIPYGRQHITEADIASVESVLRSSFLTQGPAIPAFEQAVSKKVGAAHGVAVNSATSALHIACLALGLGPEIGFGLLQLALWPRPTAVAIVVQTSISLI